MVKWTARVPKWTKDAVKQRLKWKKLKGTIKKKTKRVINKKRLA